MTSIAKSLNMFNQGIYVGFGALISFSVLTYIVNDNYNCQKKRLITQYETKISNYEKQIVNLKELINNLENKTELK